LESQAPAPLFIETEVIIGDELQLKLSNIFRG